jgi:hypothetical protein
MSRLWRYQKSAQRRVRQNCADRLIYLAGRREDRRAGTGARLLLRYATAWLCRADGE